MSDLVNTLTRGGGDTAWVVATRIADGRQVCTCISVLDGQTWIDCPVLTWGGIDGYARLPLKVPRYEPGMTLEQFPQVLVVYRSGNQVPVVVGVTQAGKNPGETEGPPQDNVASPQEEEPEHSTDIDPTEYDFHFKAGDSVFTMRNNRIYLSPAADVDVLLPEGGLFEVIKGDDDSGRLALVAPLYQALSELARIQDTLVKWAISTNIGVVASGNVKPTYSEFYGPGILAGADVLTEGQLGAGTIRVPSTSVEEEEV